MKTNFLKVGFLAFIVITLTSCYPGGAEYTSDTDIVITDHNPDYDYGSVKTYFLSDSIQHIVEDGKDIDYSMDNYIIGELETNMNNLGWERIPPPVDSLNPGPEPDVNVVVTVAEITNYNVYSYPWYPYWGWGWYWKASNDTQYYGYPGYGWGYPYYPTYVTSYTTGTILWQLFDPDLVDEENEEIIVEWFGACNGVLGSSKSNTQDRITKTINQAFNQSPYLRGE